MNHHISKVLIFFVLTLIFLSVGTGFCRIIEIVIDRPIMPPVASYIIRNLASVSKDDILILRIDTPGGLVSSTQKIIKSLLKIECPTIAFVSPRGGGAVSAGSFIAISCDLLVMNVGTRIGAAHPVSPIKIDEKIMGEKIINDILAFLKSVNSLKANRPFDKIEKMVTESISYSCDEAVRNGICDFTTESKSAMLKRISGTVWKTSNNKDKKFPENLEKMKINTKKLSIKEKILSTILSPDISFLLLTLGGLALIIEITSPGVGIPGVIGAICTISALYGLSILPVNYTGLFFIICAFILYMFELYGAGGGVLSVGATICVGLGGFYLFDGSSFIGMKVSINSILLVMGILFVFFMLILGKIVKAMRLPVYHSYNHLIGKMAVVADDFKSGCGVVFFNGETWNADILEDVQLKKGDNVIVAKIVGNKLLIKPYEEES